MTWCISSNIKRIDNHLTLICTPSIRVWWSKVVWAKLNRIWGKLGLELKCIGQPVDLPSTLIEMTTIQKFLALKAEK